MPINQTIADELRAIGLGDKGAAVYAAVLELGAAFPTKIAELASLNRTTTYHVLEDLLRKGLVTRVEKGKKLCFQAERPERLASFAKAQVREAEQQAERAKRLLPEIEGLFRLAPAKPRVRFFEGLDGVLAVYEDHVAEKHPYEMVAFSNVEDLFKLLPEDFVSRYVHAKDKKGVTTRAIFPQSAFSQSYGRTAYVDSKKETMPKLRFVPSDRFPYKSEITMYGKDKVSFINFEKNVLIGVIIEDAVIAGMMRMAFELAWAAAKG